MELLRYGRPANGGVLLQHDDAQTHPGEIGSAGQAVVARPDNGDIELTGTHGEVVTENARRDKVSRDRARTPFSVLPGHSERRLCSDATWFCTGGDPPGSLIAPAPADWNIPNLLM